MENKSGKNLIELNGSKIEFPSDHILIKAMYLMGIVEDISKSDEEAQRLIGLLNVLFED